MTTLRFTRRTALAAGLSLLTASGAHLVHAATFPDRPIRLVVGFPPSGGADIVARLVAQRLGAALGISVVVDNKPGANGTIAAADVARAPADGYTLLLGVPASQSISPALMPKIPYDAARDFTPISTIGITPLVLVVSPKLPVKNVQEFIGYVRSSKEPVTYGSAGVGNITHMAAELFVQTTGVKNLRHIPYKGSSQVVTDLIGGQIQAYFDTLPSSLPFILSGQLRALAVTGPSRASVVPDVPTMLEAGVRDYNPTNWFGLLAPARLEEQARRRIHSALTSAFQDAEARKTLAAKGLEPVFDDPERFRDELIADQQRWREVTKKAGIVLE